MQFLRAPAGREAIPEFGASASLAASPEDFSTQSSVRWRLRPTSVLASATIGRSVLSRIEARHGRGPWSLPNAARVGKDQLALASRPTPR